MTCAKGKTKVINKQENTGYGKTRIVVVHWKIIQ